MKLSTKLSLAVVVITLGCGVATSAIVSSYMSRLLERRSIDHISLVVRSLADQLADGVINEDSVALREILHGVLSPQRGMDFAYLVGGKGDVLAHTFAGEVPEGLPGVRSDPPPGREGGPLARFEHRGTSYLIGAYSLMEGNGLGRVYVGINRAALREGVRSVSVLIVSISLGVALLGVLAASYAAIRFTKPLELLTHSIVAFGRGEPLSSPVLEQGGAEIRQLSAAFHEMAGSRDRAEAALRFQGALLEALNAITLDGILIVSPDRRILYHNRRFLDIWSLPPERRPDRDEELLAAALPRLEDQAAFLDKVSHLYDHPDETSLDELAFRDGRVIERYSAPIRDDAGHHYGRVWFFRDITERSELTQHMLHAQKLESLGILAGGIAHDFNNILTSIVGNTDLAQRQLAPDSPVKENLRRIEESAQRAADLARQMLAYSGRGKFFVAATDLNRLVQEMDHVLEASISKKAHLELHLHCPLPAVEVDAAQVRQIVMNLVINASEALGEGSGVIAVTTGSMECDRQYLNGIWRGDDLDEGLYVFLEVSDTGCGMSRETQARVFDPFFTTKFTGRGLGMAAVQGIVRGHHGGIAVNSELGVGSTLRILLPASDGPV